MTMRAGSSLFIIHYYNLAICKGIKRALSVAMRVVDLKTISGLNCMAKTYIACHVVIAILLIYIIAIAIMLQCKTDSKCRSRAAYRLQLQIKFDIHGICLLCVIVFYDFLIDSVISLRYFMMKV